MTVLFDCYDCHLLSIDHYNFSHGTIHNRNVPLSLKYIVLQKVIFREKYITQALQFFFYLHNCLTESTICCIEQSINSRKNAPVKL